MLGSAKVMFRTLRFIVPLLTVAVLAGCGGTENNAESGERASASSDVNELLRSTFTNLGKMKSATVDMKLSIEPRGQASGNTGPVTASLKGPFATQGENKLPKFAFTAAMQAGGQSFNAGATWTGAKGFVSLQGATYEISELVMKQFVAGYEQSLKRGQKQSGGLVLGSLGIDFTKWLSSPKNEGEATVGDAETIKITGAANVDQVIADLDKITEKASSLSVPGAAGRVPQKLTAEQKREIRDAVKKFDVAIYTGAEDQILRRLTVTADLKDAKSEVDAAILLDVTFTKVGEDQQIEAPANPRPFSELLQALDAAGLTDLGLAGAAQDPGSGGGSGATSPNNVDKYATCIREAKDTEAARKCAELLTG